MAKKLQVVSSGLRHRNHQTFGANSATVIGEAIDNPAYQETIADNAKTRQAMLIESVEVYPDYTDMMTLSTGSDYQFQSQLQTGDRSTTPAIVNISSDYLFSHGGYEFNFLTGVGVFMTDRWPLAHEPISGLPIIVTPQFTIVHGAGINHAAYQSKPIYTVIEYSVVKVGIEHYATILLNQNRSS